MFVRIITTTNITFIFKKFNKFFKTVNFISLYNKDRKSTRLNSSHT